jgi:hypothetical protein
MIPNGQGEGVGRKCQKVRRERGICYVRGERKKQRKIRRKKMMNDSSSTDHHLISQFNCA